MLDWILGAAVLGISLYYKGKSEAEKSGQDFSELNIIEKTENIAQGIEREMINTQEKQKKILEKELKKRSDKEIQCALQNSELSSWQYEILEAEMERRGL